MCPFNRGKDRAASAVSEMRPHGQTSEGFEWQSDPLCTPCKRKSPNGISRMIARRTTFRCVPLLHNPVTQHLERPWADHGIFSQLSCKGRAPFPRSSNTVTFMMSLARAVKLHKFSMRLFEHRTQCIAPIHTDIDLVGAVSPREGTSQRLSDRKRPFIAL